MVTRQERSRQSRDAFIEAGIKLLNTMRLNDLKVADLASHSDRSVGSFYKRFEDKDAFFRALQTASIERARKIIESRISRKQLETMSPEQVLNELVDTLFEIFTSDMRGVFRESLQRILEPEDGWTLMRQSGQDIRQRVVDRLKHAYPDLSEAQTERKVAFCYQVIVGVLMNDLMNDFHAFSTSDQSVKSALKAIVTDHMNSTSDY
jgi:AcrR family transcriptional regulator